MNVLEVLGLVALIVIVGVAVLHATGYITIEKIEK